MKFDSFSISEPVLRALAEMGFEEASPIQEAIIPVILSGRDAIGQAQTGTGKTAAFGIPLVEAAREGRLSLVLVPTRELAQQVTGEIDRLGKHAGVSALALYGGAPFSPQAKAIARGDAMILVATPGRLRDHIDRGTLDPAGASLVVLDEADEMLNMGFVEEVEAILEAIDEPTGDADHRRQTLLFSATMPEAIARLAKRFLSDPEHVRARGQNDSVATAQTEQFAVQVRHAEKLDALVRILAVEQPTGTLVFRHTRETVDELVSALRGRNVAAEALHGGMPQGARDLVLARFRDGRSKVLVATNVAARGLDVDVLSHVVNYDTPREAEAYVHRIGRTGRAGREGRSFLFVTPADRGKMRGIERILGQRLNWYPVPTDAEVHAAADRNLIRWIETRTENRGALERHLALVDGMVASGHDPRSIAAAALEAAARHEGLAPPRLEVRRDNHAPPPGSRGPSHAPRVALTFSVGRDDGVRPGDLVGALTNEGGLVGADVGRIDILPRMSVAEVPTDRVEDLLATMEGASIRGRPVRMRLADNWQFRSAPAATRHARGRPKPHGANRRAHGKRAY